jgi:glycerol-3-phosphate dehydrogenase
LHSHAVQASFTKASQIVVREIFDRDCVYALQNDDRRMIYAIPYQRDLTIIATSEGGFDGEATLLTVPGAAKSMDDLGLRSGDDLTGSEVSYLMREGLARFAGDILWRRSRLGLTMSRQDHGMLATFMAAA